jgi:hypothetical protein
MNGKNKVPAKAKFTVGIALFFTLTLGVLLGSCNLEGDPETPEDELGTITGKALWSGGDSNAGIIVTVEKLVGRQSVAIPEDGRAVLQSKGTQTTTDGDGIYSFANVSEGTYTVYASSRDSKERAVTFDVQVVPGRAVTAEDLVLTPVGHLTGKITIDNRTTGNLGFLVFIAGTSFVAVTDDTGAVTISDVPAGTGYQVVVSKDNYTGVWKTAEVKKGETTDLASKNFRANTLKTGIEGLTFTLDGVMDSRIYQTGDTVTVGYAKTDIFGKNEYGSGFAGWNTKPDGTGTAYFLSDDKIVTGYTPGDQPEPIYGELLGKDTVTFGDDDIRLYSIWAGGFIDPYREKAGDPISAVIGWHSDVWGNATNLEIPETINTLQVTRINCWVFSGCDLLKNIVIPGSVKFIGRNAFFFNQELETIRIGAGVVFDPIDEYHDSSFKKFIVSYTADGEKAGLYRKNGNAWTLQP